jgi:hypothetical protein
MDPERERRRMHRRDADAAVEQEPQHRRHDAAVAAHDRRLTCGCTLMPGVVVEGHHLHAVASCKLGQVAEALRVGDLHEHHSPHAVALQGRRLHRRDLVGMQVVELAHVAVHAPLQADATTGVQKLRRKHAGERIEVGVRVRDDQRLDGDGRAHATDCRFVA